MGGREPPQMERVPIVLDHVPNENDIEEDANSRSEKGQS
jgi:hypothetical protein